MPHPALAKDNVAVITGGASGIGLAAAIRFASLGMKVCIADLGADRLKEAETKLSSASPAGGANIMTSAVDVSRVEDVAALESAVQKRFGGTDVLMNNAGISPSAKMFGSPENWQRVFAVNLWGVIHGSQVFAPHMIERGHPGLILMRDIIDYYAARNYRAFDLGIGSDDYKRLFCKSDEAIFDSFIPLSTRGKMAVAAMSAVNRAKRMVKQNPALFDMAQKLRGMLR